MKVLYICTHNRCRSILSEAITNHLAKGRIQAFSAGSHPAEHVHPLTLKHLARNGIPINGLKSRSWDDFESEKFDLVITVCDNATNELCPVWFGDSAKVHWGLPDPSKQAGSEEDIAQAFKDVMQTIEKRIKNLLALNLDELSMHERDGALSSLTKEQ
ncbi:arsenate reductase ArsC [Marinagarivorans cellulosilyticus]|uniref:Arsenate reductase (Thioredoxin) n=1 Tax=Marinagarivorans cellulosilyticus TaxID=2721545 RepID=A0AAN1WJD1_9GAMM|nr:arsenate reductase ArsC [Marinagarivorans cellulosilyticus]BCD98721.1 arsenate reductase (thioredoxin) [Marinagarivorans cellulosilyticus]